MKKAYIVGMLITAVIMSGCAQVNKSCEKESSRCNSFINSNYNAADILINNAAKKMPKGSSVIMATVVNIDSIETSSTLGRVISEQVTTRFVDASMEMIELKFRDSIYVKQNEGELALTREISKIAKERNANAVIVGTYAVSDSDVYVNLRVVDPVTNVSIAATDYVLPLNDDMRIMLGIKTKFM
jgi:TolB-like protein